MRLGPSKPAAGPEEEEEEAWPTCPSVGLQRLIEPEATGTPRQQEDEASGINQPGRHEAAPEPDAAVDNQPASQGGGGGEDLSCCASQSA